MLRVFVSTDYSLHSISELTADVMAEPVLGLPDHLPPRSQEVANNNHQAAEGLILSRSSSRDDEQSDEEEASYQLFGEGVVALHGLARLLIAQFLLRPAEKGATVSERVARVSVKTLALACVSEVLLHQPQAGSGPLFIVTPNQCCGSVPGSEKNVFRIQVKIYGSGHKKIQNQKDIENLIKLLSRVQ